VSVGGQSGETDALLSLLTPVQARGSLLAVDPGIAKAAAAADLVGPHLDLTPTVWAAHILGPGFLHRL
jgi:hypothetical protein